MRPWLLRWVPVIAWMGLIFYLSSQPDLPHPKAFGLETLQDITGHFLEYAILACFLYRTSVGQAHRVFRLSGTLLFSLGVASIYALSDELHQSFVPYRQASWADIATDAAGIVTALVVLHLWQRRQQERVAGPADTTHGQTPS